MQSEKFTVYMVIIITFIVGNIYSQEKDFNDAVFLRDGSTVWGKIIENNRVDSLKIQTRSGSIFTFAPDQILKITQGKNGKQTDISPNSQDTEINPQINTNENKFPAPKQIMQNVTNYIEPQLNYKFSADVGNFSISAGNFSRIYGKKSIMCYGGNVEIRIEKQLFAAAKLKYITSKSKSIDAIKEDVSITNSVAEWNQYWIALGCKIYLSSHSVFTPFIGAGIAHFDVSENVKGIVTTEDSVSNLNVSAANNKWGLAIYGGINLRVMDNISFLGEIEYTSARLKRDDEEMNKTFIGGFNFNDDIRILGNDINIGGIFLGAGLQIGL